MNKQKLITILAILAIICGSISIYLMEGETPAVESAPTTDTIVIVDTIK